MSRGTATVLLTTDASATVGVRLAGTGQIGVVTGTGKSHVRQPGCCGCRCSTPTPCCSPGEQLVTFGSVGGSPYVPGVPVGVITKVEGSGELADQLALVRPYADDTALGVVGVVVVPPRHNPRFSVLPPPADPGPEVTVTVTASPGAPGRASAPATPTPGATGRGAEVRRAASCWRACSLAAILIQLTVLNSLPLPGGAGPDLVLVVVVAVALTGGPMEGMLTGFCAGLALDVAPPASHLVGQYALVFCLVGYACGAAQRQPRAVQPGCRSARWPWARRAARLLYALAGMMFGDPDVTWSAVRHVLPASVVYDVLLSPFVLYAAVAARAWTTPGWAWPRLPGRRRRGPLARPAWRSRLGWLGRPAPGRPGHRDRAQPAAEARAAARHGDGWIGGASQRLAAPRPRCSPPGPPHLRLRGGAGRVRQRRRGRASLSRPGRCTCGFGHGRGRVGPRRPGHEARPAPPVHLRSWWQRAGRRRRCGGPACSDGRVPGGTGCSSRSARQRHPGQWRCARRLRLGSSAGRGGAIVGGAGCDRGTGTGAATPLPAPATRGAPRSGAQDPARRGWRVAAWLRRSRGRGPVRPPVHRVADRQQADGRAVDDPGVAAAPGRAVRGGGGAADLARRPAVVPAGDDRPALRAAGRAGPDPDR